MSAHTKGEWVVVVEPERPDEPAIMVDEWYVATCHDNANDGDTLANARLIAAAPELYAVADDFEISGPDADGLVWLILHGKGTSKRAMINLGTADMIAAQVALYLEEDRRAAIAKATGATP